MGLKESVAWIKKSGLNQESAHHGFLIFIATTIVNILGFSFNFVISRKVGIEQYGTLSALNALLTISMVASNIIAIVVTQNVAVFYISKDNARIGNLVKKSILYGTFGAIIIIGLGILLMGPIASYLKINDTRIVLMIFTIMGIGIIVPGLRSVFNSVEDFRGFALALIVEPFLKFVLGTWFVYHNYDILGVCFAWLCADIIAAIGLSIVLSKRYPITSKVFDVILNKNYQANLVGIAGATILLAGLSNIDIILVKHLADATTAGLYAAVSLTGKILVFSVGFIPTIILPRIVKKTLCGESTTEILIGSGILLTLISGLSLICYAVFPSLIITAVAGVSFAKATPYVFPYGIAMVLLAIIGILITYHLARNDFRFVIPLSLSVIAEISGILIYHKSISQIIQIIICGNIIALIICAQNLTKNPFSKLQAKVDYAIIN